MKYGYARVSTDDQNAALQLSALRRAGSSAHAIFRDEGISGATTQRAGLLRCLNTVQAGDTLIVWKLDRLGRSLRDLIQMLDDPKQRGVKFRSVADGYSLNNLTAKSNGDGTVQFGGEDLNSPNCLPIMPG